MASDMSAIIHTFSSEDNDFKTVKVPNMEYLDIKENVQMAALQH
jgi:hypothetical protein